MYVCVCACCVRPYARACARACGTSSKMCIFCLNMQVFVCGLRVRHSCVILFGTSSRVWGDLLWYVVYG